jgi:hypothetical protein
MTLPSLLLGVLISLLIGASFHFWRGGNLARLLMYLGLSMAGFMAGQWIGGSRNWVFLPIGPLNLGAALTGSLLFLGLGYWLSLVEIGRASEAEDDAV